eukprot:102115-Prorocentrum_lima.AAC.1
MCLELILARYPNIKHKATYEYGEAFVEDYAVDVRTSVEKWCGMLQSEVEQSLAEWAMAVETQKEHADW